MPAHGARSFQNHIAFFLLTGEIRDRHRIATLHTKHRRQDSLPRLFRNRAPQHRRLRRELSVAHAHENTQPRALRPATTSDSHQVASSPTAAADRTAAVSIERHRNVPLPDRKHPATRRQIITRPGPGRSTRKFSPSDFRPVRAAADSSETLPVKLPVKSRPT